MSSIFLSHNHRDKDFVNELSKKLLLNGILTWVDGAEIKVGDSLINKISQAIYDFEYLGVILSPNSVDSEWVNREVNIALNQEIKGKKVKVIPILYRNCEIPPFLLDKFFADFRNDFQEGISVLMNRFQSNLRLPEEKAKRIQKLLIEAFQNWLSLNQNEEYLLPDSTLDLIDEYLYKEKFSANLLIFISKSFFYRYEIDALEKSNVFNLLTQLSSELTKIILEESLLKSSKKIRKTCLYLINKFDNADLSDLFNKILISEKEKGLIIYTLKQVFKLKYQPEVVLLKFFHDNPNWEISAYSNLINGNNKLGLFISSDSEFSFDLSELFVEQSYKLIKINSALFKIQMLDLDELLYFKFIVISNEEHFYRVEKQGDVYNILVEYVNNGGILLATPWVSWETIEHTSFKKILPVVYLNKFVEGELILLKMNNDKLAPLITSYEILKLKKEATLILATATNNPIISYLKSGKGICIYLNICQHTCISSISSPLKNNRELKTILTNQITNLILD